jgi:hypothetical protein
LVYDLVGVGLRKVLEKPKKGWDLCRTCTCAIVPGGGVDKMEEYKSDGKFLFPVKALSKVFRAKYCEALQAKSPDNTTRVRNNFGAVVVLHKSLSGS